ncbi:extracellular solute-binding protein [Paenibacillus sp. GSMTC-2017]|uniref:ABC transporter substrate-binding protein n=1 Tax=Paenibacillus sp. GSMTC-2017 TaxID=2794350 RepID=UPI0018D61FF3|nr:extracellular solute-binding protein [Paenibacillus sp. GSMTC-2017]MBH5317440.1 extracellular solute-binding protein [Paenibacillus sp. GSMTC-2017]
MKKQSWISLGLVAILLVLSGCGKVSSSNEAVTKEKQPVTLTFWNYGNTITDTEFNKLIVEPTRAKYPHITLERIKTDAETTPDELILTGQLPDIVYTSSGPAFYRFLDIGVVQELDNLIKKYEVDTNRIKPVILKSIKSFSPQGKIIAIPLSFNLLVTYYNKEIFDKFYVPYPSDEPKTWSEWLDLGRKLTVADDGTQYIGIDLGGPGIVARSIHTGNVDEATGKSALSDPDWTKVYDLMKEQYDIPGYVGPNNELLYDRSVFMEERRIAIKPHFLANMVGPLEELRAKGVELDWDIAPAPHFGNNEVGGSIHSLILSNQSKHIDDAFLVIANILSDETQKLVSRNGRVPSIVNPELEKEFGADIEVLKGKKIENVFKLTPKQNNPPHPLDNELNTVLTKAAEDIALNGKDVNSALRSAEEASNQLIDTWENTRAK